MKLIPQDLLSHNNPLAQDKAAIAAMDNTALQALYEQIQNYRNPGLRETLLAQLKQEHPDFKPKINARKFLQHVAYGQQNEAESMLKQDEALAQELLTARGIEFTDYSERTFKCSAYEYAWWAKDSHMRFMLERYMDDNTRNELLKRVKHIERRTGDRLFKEDTGLAYTQDGIKYRSTHFDLTPLKQALERYIEAYRKSLEKSDADCSALDALWIQVGLPQRELPAHVVQEYCHRGRSFQDIANHPGLLDAANPDNLKRSLEFYNWNTRSRDVWFAPGVPPKSSGMGSSFAILRAGLYGLWGPVRSNAFSNSDLCSLDLAAIESLDEARTKDLERSLEHLAGHSLSSKPDSHNP